MAWRSPTIGRSMRRRSEDRAEVVRVVRVARAAVRGVVIVALVGACNEAPRPFEDVREPCADQNPLRNLYWGDLHVHTAYSFDAWLNDVRADPSDAYRFARGEAVALPPLDAEGRGTREVRLERPLDFVAVTDHSEYLAEVAGCTTPGSAIYESERCVSYRGSTGTSLVGWGLGLDADAPTRFADLCGAGGIACEAEAAKVWGRVQEAAEAAYDRTSACELTTFVAYEWSGSKDLSNLHRNVIFRSATVPGAPISHFEAPTPFELWTRLRAECPEAAPECDVLSIPHNPNWSNGALFHPEAPAGEDPAAVAGLRAAMEPLLEVYQHKGDSECMNGLSGVLGAEDEACEFEKLRRPPVEDCGDAVGSNGILGWGCVSRLDYLRGILIEGMKEELRVGVNPFRVGVIASTDTHNGTPGLVDEVGFAGHFGSRDATPEARLEGLIPVDPTDSPGGLVAVWAEDKSRESIFDALRRREAYGTSGPRIAVRVFAGFGLPEDLCGRADLVAVGDGAGVPMGGILPAASGGEGPSVVVSALADPGTPSRAGTPLQRVEVIKGWVDGEGEGHVEVFTVAGGDDGASVDEATCEAKSAGAASLCGVWRDPAFDPAAPAFYYARVLEDPTCRWSRRDCLALPEGSRPAICDAPGLPRVIQERAWTSPIWYVP